MKFHSTSRITRRWAGKVLPFLAFSIVLLLLIQGCGKQDRPNANGPGQTADILTQQEATKAKIRLLVQQNGWKVTVPVHQRMDFFIGDSLGNRVPLPNVSHRTVAPMGTKTTDIVSACDGNPNGYAILNSYSLVTDCVNGYKISFNTTISSDDKILAVSPYNSARTSKGSLRIYNSSNTQIYSNLSIAIDPVTSPPVDLGPDNTTPGNELFSVTFTSGFIAESVFDPSPAAGYTMKLGALYETDCSDLETSNGGLWSQAVTSTQLPDLSPLNRVDPIYPNPGSDSFQVSVYGMYAGVTCTMALTAPDLQEIEYSTDTGRTWIGDSATSTMGYIATLSVAPYVNLIAGTSGEHYGYVDPYGVMELGIGGLTGGTVLLRYRDIVFLTEPTGSGSYPIPHPEPGIGNNCTPGPWSDPIVFTY